MYNYFKFHIFSWFYPSVQSSTYSILSLSLMTCKSFAQCKKNVFQSKCHVIWLRLAVLLPLSKLQVYFRNPLPSLLAQWSFLVRNVPALSHWKKPTQIIKTLKFRKSSLLWKKIIEVFHQSSTSLDSNNSNVLFCPEKTTVP